MSACAFCCLVASMCFGPAPRDAALRRVFGDHRRAWAAARIFHEEAGNSVLLVDMNIEVALADARRIEALAKGFIRGCAARLSFLPFR